MNWYYVAKFVEVLARAFYQYRIDIIGAIAVIEMERNVGQLDRAIGGVLGVLHRTGTIALPLL
jgi:hypothetical protein